MSPRTQAARTEATTGQLLAAARELFGRDGFAATSIDAVAAAGGVTKGAAYHHFATKGALFRAVFVGEQDRVTAELLRTTAQEPDPFAALRRGCRTFLELCLEPAFRQIVLLDGPAVLGWQEVRAIQSERALRVLADGMRVAAALAGEPGVDVTARAHLAFGALCEAGMLLARADDPDAALHALLAEAERLVGAMARP
ncbi:TetR/AcrR family transcriptional regulator [Pseudonocardia humida]|uniref:TetR/AcrR family transcriptional regulator n=1 Tax=Pseudonocardia humida TaxID=2800819 RepID=A0ABT0ZWI1_9PSEU|nr:TetR/AcrR family transcriptional regulator [Pseudonocardia humida]MCO1655104.1 TetR/AcrR family transcriptional regulator [Pseudonocardia humida]